MAFLTYKFRLYPNATQTRAMEQQLETLRQVYNATLGYWKDYYAEHKKSPTPTELYRVFSNLRNLQIEDQKAGGPGPHWLTHVAAVSIRDTIKRVKKAFDGFFRRLKTKAQKAGFPRFKGRGRLKSIPFDNYGAVCKLRGDHLSLFGIGKVKAVVHRDIVGAIKTARIIRDADGKWYGIFFALQPDAKIEPKEGPAVGIDVGLEHFLTTSDGEHVANPRFLKGELKRLRRSQRKSSRKTVVAKKAKRKFWQCRNLQKSFRETARLHVRVRNLRREFHYQTANRLIDRYATVCAEDLNVQGMVRNGKLSRAISDAGWAGFLTILSYQAAKAGAEFVKVDARGTSQTCPQCQGKVRKELKERRHNCPHCEYETQRDHASAQVILQRGLGGAGLVPVRLNVAHQGERAERNPACPFPLKPHDAKSTAATGTR